MNNGTENILSMLGLAKKAGRLEAGEEPVGAAARARSARLILLAEDAADNTVRRARHFADAGACLCAQIPASKDALGRAVGRTSCAMLALTDVGFAEAVGKKLAALDETRYGELAERLSVKASRAAERKAEQKRRDKNVRTGKKHNKK
ncbi:MAG: 50S ribosomal protein L7 [Ruminococcaceae bacterium]|nr:50S ribosomal protein L7 [Oscillospiraceae bacterium]